MTVSATQPPENPSRSETDNARAERERCHPCANPGDASHRTANSRDYVAEVRQALEQAGTADRPLEIPMGDVAEAVVAIMELRGFALALPPSLPRNKQGESASQYVLDRCDVIARILGLGGVA